MGLEDKHFCYTCGAETEDVRMIYAYDEDSGEPQISVAKRCPNKGSSRFIIANHPVTKWEAYANGPL